MINEYGLYKLIDDVERLRTYPTDEELQLTLEVAELIRGLIEGDW